MYSEPIAYLRIVDTPRIDIQPVQKAGETVAEP